MGEGEEGMKENMVKNVRYMYMYNRLERITILIILLPLVVHLTPSLPPSLSLCPSVPPSLSLSLFLNYALSV